MAEVENYRHIHLRGLGKASEDFRARGRGSKKRPPPIADRAAHADLLRQQLEESIADLEQTLALQEESGVPRAKRGASITFSARPSVAIDVGSKRSTSPGLKLLAVRRATGEEGDNESPEQATFFVVKNSLKTLRENLDRYAEWHDRPEAGANEESEEDEEDAGRPRNFWLFESGATIRSATLRDFWTDRLDRFPRRKTQTDWEVWTRPGFEKSFMAALEKIGIKPLGMPTAFIETIVRNVSATPQQLERLVRSSAAVVELRSASTFVSDFYDMEPERRASVMSKIASRISGPPADAPRIAILDTGVNRSHDLLSSSLPQSRCYTIEKAWGTTDAKGHGTRMAGVAQFGDLEGISSSSPPLVLQTALESVVVASPNPPGDVPARDALRRAVALVEREPHRRIFCLAQTAQGEEENGRPTSTSAVLDQLAYGDGENARLFCAAVGNVPHSPEEPYQIADYEDRNEGFGIQAPAQALNALSVGAASLKDLGTKGMVAPVGDLMPTSRTAGPWVDPHPSKPDIVMEGGNFSIEKGGVFSRPSPAHMVVTTSHLTPSRPLTISGETSTATAMAAGLAARLAARYPLYRMETIRGLMVHSAEWTPAMLDQLARDRAAGYSAQEAMKLLLGRYGWGVPNEQRLFASASNALTLIVEDDLQPYERSVKDDGKLGNIRLREMKYFKLPWPETVLRQLNQTPVELRCTLSYFVEPDPHAAARGRAIDRYPSHRLRFDVKRSGESDERAQLRNNELAEGDISEAAGSGDGWALSSRSKGTLVQDVWRGKAYQLADRDGISVVPVRGWWGDMPTQDRYERTVNYSLIVSVRTPSDAGGDLYAEIVPKIPATVLVEAGAT
ncbi:S8 family peptidase [Bradyrhizobium sp. 164]|uniref:S8 family peptidase n=1 Tax=Bradyrhizobium sp. 164 TaxID=2782637 RepID=UPI001FFACA95|nr:S8 family peptidase [Bradyrhizobium sp. 164]MCK1598828.1 S8 family peptidase [Bradyrhizobium sp. 164]